MATSDKSTDRAAPLTNLAIGDTIEKNHLQCNESHITALASTLEDSRPANSVLKWLSFAL